MTDDADETIRKAALAGLPINLRRRRAESPSSSNAPDERPNDPASSSGTDGTPGSASDDRGVVALPADPGEPDEDLPPIETLTWRDGRWVLESEEPKRTDL